ncbi:MAG: hypothetical protein M3373_14765 [Gemmatimonadota bacterium]|nr:hypothetical protein [Gemmatimonadota bacterium]
MEITLPNADSQSPGPDPSQLRRERLRLADFRFTRTPDGRCSAEVALELDRTEVRGTAVGLSNSMVDLRIASEATLVALDAFTEHSYRFELIGVKAVRAFDANVIIVSVAMKHGLGPQRLLGVALVEEEPVRGAVLAVLNATNRILGNFIATR